MMYLLINSVIMSYNITYNKGSISYNRSIFSMNPINPLYT